MTCYLFKNPYNTNGRNKSEKLAIEWFTTNIMELQNITRVGWIQFLFLQTTYHLYAEFSFNYWTIFFATCKLKLLNKIHFNLESNKKWKEFLRSSDANL